MTSADVGLLAVDEFGLSIDADEDGLLVTSDEEGGDVDAAMVVSFGLVVIADPVDNAIVEAVSEVLINVKMDCILGSGQTCHRRERTLLHLQPVVRLRAPPGAVHKV